VAAAAALARDNGLRVEEPTVLNDLFSLMVYLRPVPVVARVATCMPKARHPPRRRGIGQVTGHAGRT
jgi:hypothetical protein